MSKQQPLKNFNLNFKIWLSTPDGKGVMGDGKWQILKAIEKHGSLKAATKALGLTYRRTWGDLKAIEEQFGFPLLEKSRGGAEGGKSELSPEGKNLVNAFDAFHAKVDVMMDEAFREFRQNLEDEQK
jgi:molybdate transport system regulatory protein